MALRHKIVFLVFLSLSLSLDFFAEETSQKTSTDSDLKEHTLPEIVVKGDDPLYLIKMNVLKAEKLKYDIFNSLISTNDYKITCGWRANLGTRIKHWECDVRYLKNVGAEAGSSTLHNIISEFNTITDLKEGDSGRSYWLPSREQMKVNLAWKTRDLNKAMKALAVEHPELAIAMARADSMKQYYEAESRKRNKDNILTGDSKLDEQDVIPNEIEILQAAFLDHSRGAMSDEIWGRWDSLYKKIFQMKTYQIFWTSANKNKVYTDEFVKYVNSIIPEERQ